MLQDYATPLAKLSTSSVDDPGHLSAGALPSKNNLQGSKLMHHVAASGSALLLGGDLMVTVHEVRTFPQVPGFNT